MHKPPAPPVPATTMAAVRYLAAILVPVAVKSGWLGAEWNAGNVVSLIGAALTVGYGLWKTHDRQKQLSADATSRVR